MRRAALLALALALLPPLRAAALEPRFDHRDQQGWLMAVETARENETVRREGTLGGWHPRLRLGWSIDPWGAGDEIVLGASAPVDAWSDPRRERNLLALDARYRGYFGLEELKTFFEVGAWSQLRSRFSVGPQVGLGLQYDPSRSYGAFVSVGFQAGVGKVQVATFGAAAGLQVRFE